MKKKIVRVTSASVGDKTETVDDGGIENDRESSFYGETETEEYEYFHVMTDEEDDEVDPAPDVNIYFWKQKIPEFIYDVEYEKLVEDKEGEIRKILKFCELDWDDKCLSPEKNSKTPIKTVSIAQARQPIYKTSLNNSNNFDKYLGNMYNILKQNID